MTEPLEGVVPWLPAPSLEVSVERSVRKLAFDRRRRSLKLRKDGAMAGRDCELSSSKVTCERRFVGSKRTSSKARLLSVPVEEDEEIKQTTRFGNNSLVSRRSRQVVCEVVCLASNRGVRLWGETWGTFGKRASG